MCVSACVCASTLAARESFSEAAEALKAAASRTALVTAGRELSLVSVLAVAIAAVLEANALAEAMPVVVAEPVAAVVAEGKAVAVEVVFRVAA
eukprot:5424093-Pleurochrysis_carterae.AAC.1